VFSVEVPTVSSRARGPGASVDPEPCRLDLSGKLVVVIDDDAQVLEGTRRALQDWGCRVITAETIGSALAKIGEERQPPDLVLADFRLRGEETGLMAIDLINRVVGTDTPAVIVTGDTDPRRLREATGSGYALLHKPVRVETLRAVVESELAT
jgi:DNA-binding NtrC family response regulator